jgi:hypothetical protein
VISSSFSSFHIYGCLPQKVLKKLCIFINSHDPLEYYCFKFCLRNKKCGWQSRSHGRVLA